MALWRDVRVQCTRSMAGASLPASHTPACVLDASLRSARQKQELLRITHENKAIYRRISTKQPHYSARQWVRTRFL